MRSSSICSTMSSASASSRPTSAKSKRPPAPPASALCFPVARFVNPPPSQYRCSIDGGVMRDAVKSRVCGHVFGLQCAIYHSLEQETCPTCGAAMDASDLEPVEHIRDAISMLPIRCAEGAARCSWVGPLREEARHVNGQQCSVQRVDCPFCDKKGIEVGSQFEAHKEVCDECVVICSQCCEDMPRKHLAVHLRSCTGDMIEPLRRQKENVAATHATQKAAPAAPGAPLTKSAMPAVQSVAKTNASGASEEIEKDDDDFHDEPEPAFSATNSSIRVYPSPSTAEGTRQEGNEATAIDVEPRARSIPQGQSTAVDSSDDFSPAPAPASLPNTRPASGRSSHDTQTATLPTEEREPCPFAGFGCQPGSHINRHLMEPSVLHEHLIVMATAFQSLQTQFSELRENHEQLLLTVESQKKTIKMLEVRHALHSGKLQLPATSSGTSGALANSANQPRASAGLVESPRVVSSQKAAFDTKCAEATKSENTSLPNGNGVDAAKKATSDIPKAHDITSPSKTPAKHQSTVKKGNQTTPSASGASRSHSSPAATDRPKVQTSGTAAPTTPTESSSQVPLFVPSMPKKKPSVIATGGLNMNALSSRRATFAAATTSAAVAANGK